MESALPKTPSSRGRSRFSKALPLPPEAAPAPPTPISKDRSSARTSNSTSMDSPLPPIPRESPPLPRSKVSAMTIPRRPVGNAPSEHSKSASIASISSTCSTSPGFSRSLSTDSNTTKDSLSEIDSDSALTPPLPPKDIQRQELPDTPNKILTTPPSRPLWKRRSVKSDRSINISELTLQKSNGSTASPPRQPPPARALPRLPQLPRSLQGRAIPARPAPPQPQLVMGNELSKKLKDRKNRFPESSQDAQPQTFTVSSVRRLATPDYLLKAMKEHPQVTPQVLSPKAPDTPPTEPPVVPQKSESRGTSAIKLVPDVWVDTTNRTNIFSSQSGDSTATLTVNSEPKVRSPQPQTNYVARILTPQPSPPSESSTTSPLALPSPVPNPTLDISFPVATLSSATRPDTDISPSTPIEVSNTKSYKSSPSSPGFTMQFSKPSTPITPGTVLQGPELGIVHYECYQSHRQMRSSANKICPTACMICRKKEAGSRWRCSFCCLSACAGCMQVLSSVPGRDLKLCLERLEGRGDGGGDERVGRQMERTERGSQRTGVAGGFGSWK